MLYVMIIFTGGKWFDAGANAGPEILICAIASGAFRVILTA